MVPASSGAAVTVGQVTDTPNKNCQPGTITFQSQVNSGGSPRAPFTVPAGGGVITSWATRAGATAGTQGSLKVLRRGANPSVNVVGASAVQSLTPNSVNSFATRIPVTGGENIGFAVPAGAPVFACNTNSDNADNVIAGPDPSPGTQFSFDDQVFPANHSLMNLSASLEGDADRDGFGDETQDRCRGAAGANGGCPTGSGGGGGGTGSDTTKPTLGRMSFARGSFAAASSGAAYTSQKKKHKKPPVGSKFSFTLSETSAVKFTIERKTSGRRVDRKCKTKTRRNRNKPKCTLYKKVSGSFTVNGKPGRNTITFRGRIGGRKLRTGSYRMTGTATDSARNASTPAKATFRIIK